MNSFFLPCVRSLYNKLPMLLIKMLNLLLVLRVSLRKISRDFIILRDVFIVSLIMTYNINLHVTFCSGLNNVSLVISSTQYRYIIRFAVKLGSDKRIRTCLKLLLKILRSEERRVGKERRFGTE